MYTCAHIQIIGKQTGKQKQVFKGRQLKLPITLSLLDSHYKYLYLFTSV